MAVSFLNVLLTADGKQLSTQLKRSQRDVRRYSYLVRRDFRQLSRTISRSTIVAVAGLTALSKAALTSADNIAKSARNAGLAADDYQRLAHIFELSGSSASALTKSSLALSRQIFNLGRDSLEAVDNFAALGLEFADFNALSRGDQLNLVVQRLAQLTNETTKAAVAQALFGRAGKELGTLLETNADEIQRLQDRFESLGGVIGDSALKNAERFNDELTTLTTVLRSQFTVGLVDALGATGEFNDTIRQLGEIAASVGRGFVNFTRFIVEHRKTIIAIIAGYGAYRVATSSLLRNIVKLIGSASGTIGIVGLTAAITTLGTVLGGLIVAGGVIYTFIELLDNMNDHVNGVRESLGDLSSRSKQELGNEIERVRKRIKELTLEFVNLDIATSTVFGGVGFQTRRDLNDQINTLIEQRKILQAEFDKVLTIQIVPEVVNAVLVDLIQQAREQFLQSRRSVRLDLEPSSEDRRFLSFATDARERTAQAALDATRRLADEVIRNREALIANSLAQRTNARFLESQRDRRSDQEPSGLDIFNLRNARTAVSERQTEIDQITRGIASDFNSSLRSAFRMGDFSDIGRVLLASITGALTDRLADQLTAVFESFLSSSFSGAGSGGGFFGSLFGFHEGGRVPGGRNTEVPAVLQGGELVLTEDQQRMLGGSVTIIQNITGNVDDATRRFLRNNADEVGQVVTSYQRENRVYG